MREALVPPRLTARVGPTYKSWCMSVIGPHKFDPRRAITVDLPAGQIRVALSSRVLLPADALVALCSIAGENATVQFGRALGEAMGLRVRERFVPSDGLPGDGVNGVRAASFAVVVEHLAGELALAGLGSLSAERWGKVLALVVERSPVAEEPIGDVMLCGVLGAALAASTGGEASVVPVAREASRTRFLVLREAAVDAVLTALEAGVSWGELVERLNGGPS